MSTFEIIFIGIIYMFGYGYTLANIANNNTKQHKEPSTFFVIDVVLFALQGLYIFLFY